MEYILGVDIGTSSTKAVAIGRDGHVLRTEQAAYGIQAPLPGYSEQPPEIIWQAFVKTIRRQVEFFKTSPVAISLSSAMHSIMPVDINGTPQSNLVTWADNRSAAIAERIRNSAAGEGLYRQTGTPIHSMSPLCKIEWFRVHAPEQFNSAFKFISMKEYIWLQLFGVYEVDYSIASACGLFDIIHGRWSDEALAGCGIDSSRLSTPVATSHRRTGIRNGVAEQTGLSTETVCFIGASDGCLASLGSFAIDPGVASLTIGTSGAIRVAGKKPTYNFDAMTFNYVLDETTFISGGPINNGGVVWRWYVETFLDKSVTAAAYSAIIHDTENIAPGADGLVFLPYLFGERAPLWNSDACGVFFGMTAQHTRQHFTRAVVEGICLALYHIYARLAENGLQLDEIHVSGGFVQSETWMQILADIFGKPIGLFHDEDASAVGAAYLAMKHLHMIDSYAALKPVSVRWFQPRADLHDTYKETVFPMFRNLTDTLHLNMSVRATMMKETPLNTL